MKFSILDLLVVMLVCAVACGNYRLGIYCVRELGENWVFMAGFLIPLAWALMPVTVAGFDARKGERLTGPAGVIIFLFGGIVIQLAGLIGCFMGEV